MESIVRLLPIINIVARLLKIRQQLKIFFLNFEVFIFLNSYVYYNFNLTYNFRAFFFEVCYDMIQRRNRERI